MKAWFHIGGRCEEFVYGGCNGNENRFRSREECEYICQVKSVTPPCEPRPTTNARHFIVKYFVIFCLQGIPVKCISPISPTNQGPCRIPRIAEKWYYDSGTSGCTKVTREGCFANVIGGYDSMEECVKMCVPYEIFQIWGNPGEFQCPDKNKINKNNC